MRDNYKCENPSCDYTTYIVKGNYITTDRPDAGVRKCPECGSRLIPQR